VGKPSATGQQTRPTQPFIVSGSINEWYAGIACVLPCIQLAPSGESYRGTAGLVKVMAAYCWADGLKSPAGLLSVHRD